MEERFFLVSTCSGKDVVIACAIHRCASIDQRGGCVEHGVCGGWGFFFDNGQNGTSFIANDTKVCSILAFDGSDVFVSIGVQYLHRFGGLAYQRGVHGLPFFIIFYMEATCFSGWRKLKDKCRSILNNVLILFIFYFERE